VNVDKGRLADRLRTMTIAFARLGEDFDHRYGLHGFEGAALLAAVEAHAAGDPITPGRLGALLRLPSASVTALVDRMERDGHLHRVRDDRDRRRVRVVPSAPALAAWQEYWGGLGDRVLAALDEFGPGDLAAAERFLTRMTEVAEDFRQGGADASPAGDTVGG
jgi:DNA-binding MarR family transcriptional regulator